MSKAFYGDAKFYFFSKVFQGFSFLISLKVFTHFLSPVDFGTYSTISVTLTAFVLFSTTWIGATIIRLQPKYGTNDAFLSSLTSLLFLTLTISSVILIIIFSFSLFGDANFIFLLLVLVIFLATSIFNYLLCFYRASRESNIFAYLTFFQAITFLFVSFIFLWVFKGGVKMIFLAQLFSLIIPIIYILRNNTILLKFFYWDKKIIIEILSYGLPAIFIQLFVSFAMFSDQLILKYYNLHDQVGIYAANYTLIDKSINVIGSIFITSFQPILFGLWENESPQKAYVFFNKILRMYFVVIVILSLSIYLSYDLLVKYILDSNFYMGNSFSYILMGSILLSLSNFYSEILTANKKTGLIAIIYGVATIISLVANLYFVPSMGMKATAMVNVLTYSILFVGMFIMSQLYLRKT